MSARTRRAVLDRRRKALHRVFIRFAQQTGTSLAFAAWGYSQRPQLLFMSGRGRAQTLVVRAGHEIETLWAAWNALRRIGPAPERPVYSIKSVRITDSSGHLIMDADGNGTIYE
jgi:hypothetical protein